jgi:hypothetical protein
MRALTNTTPLIALAQCGRFDLLRLLFDKVLLPPAVYREVVQEGNGRPGAEETQNAITAGWLEIQALQTPARAHNFRRQLLLGDGESEVLALVQEQPVDVILLDEARAVQHARAMGLPVLRTVGLLLQGKAQGHLHLVQPDLDHLRLVGFRLSEAVYKSALRHAGEAP